jgi:hypothetical protein
MLRNSNLAGYRIPHLTQKIITRLFADDTTVYIMKNDSFADLQDILNTWCKASGAKFNIVKTEVILIGSKEYRDQVIQTRKMNLDQQPIPQNIHIVKDGEPVRILGAWMGNQINSADPWTKTLEKITRSLHQWNKGHPTLKGRQLIVQMVVGGMTQFLTKAQGEMPPDIESKIIKMIRAFIWNSDTTPSINVSTLSLPQAEGGINLLDLKARNKAIQAPWIQEYLKFNELRPAWAYIADEIINTQLAGRHTEKQARINMFLQQWSVNPNATSKLPRDLINTVC